MSVFAAVRRWLPGFVMMVGVACGATPAAVAEPQAAATPAAAEPRRLTIGYFVLPPFSMTEGSAATGAAVDYFSKYIAPAMAVEAKFVERPFVRLLSELKEKKLDAALLLGRNPEREQVYHFSDQPYVSDHPGLVIKATHALTSITKIDDILPLSIVFAQGGYYSPMMRDKRIKIIPLALGAGYVETMLKQVESERADAAYLPTLTTLKFTAVQMKTSATFRFLPLPEEKQLFFTVFRSDLDPALIAAYNKANEKAIQAKVIEDLVESYVK